MHFNPKNEHNSKSVNSFDAGAISDLDQVTTCPGMYLLCLAMRFIKIPTDGKVSCMTPKLTKFLKKVLSGEPKVNFSGPAGGSTHHKAAFAPGYKYPHDS